MTTQTQINLAIDGNIEALEQLSVEECRALFAWFRTSAINVSRGASGMNKRITAESFKKQCTYHMFRNKLQYTPAGWCVAASIVFNRYDAAQYTGRSIMG